MKNVKVNQVTKVYAIQMFFAEFKGLVEELTDGLKTVQYEYNGLNIYVVDSDRAKELEAYDNQNMIELLSEHFGVNVIAYSTVNPHVIADTDICIYFK